uniref:Gag-Pol polyprotein n=1 Tax=Tanacetum cinerariifolium TaxID=118510 RepID=A0A6L2P137_TANCI|nr:hypothetical protein [Tanacetum cinerariifolium]
MMKGFDIRIQGKKAKNEWKRFTSTDGELIKSYNHRFSKLMNDFKRNKRFPEKIANDLRAEQLAKSHDPLALMANSNNPFNYPMFHQDQPSPSTYMQQPQPNNNYNPQPSFNQNYMQQPMPNPKDIIDPTTTMNMALVLMAKEFKLIYSTPTTTREFHQTHAIGKLLNQNPNRNDIVVAARAEGNAIGNNGNQIRCYNYRGLGYFAKNCIVRPRRRDATYLQTQLLIAQKEEAGIQLQVEEFDLMAAAVDLYESGKSMQIVF